MDIGSSSSCFSKPSGSAVGAITSDSATAVTLTNDEATTSKNFAVSLNYWSDPYINLFCKQAVRKAPEINRGYFARVVAVRSLVEQFIKAHRHDCQVISLGAGYDTLFWNLHDLDLTPTKYVEIDLHSVTRQKTILIHSGKGKLLQPLSDEIEIMGAAKLGLRSPRYCLLPADLKNSENLNAQLEAASVDFSKPTLVLLECVLMYMPEANTDRLLSYLSEKFTQCHLVNYDMTNMHDRFAQVMIENLSSRQCTLHLQDCQSNDSQLKRFNRCGWASCIVKGMNDLYLAIPAAERSRVERLEMLDEVHLLSELMSHYCICIASNSQQLALELDNLHTSIGRTS